MNSRSDSVFLITGPSASGKTTVARLLAERFPRGVHVEGDVFRRSIVTGRQEATPELSAEALSQLRLRYRLAAAAADGYFDEGFTVVLDDVVAGPLLTEYVELIESRPLHVVVLLPTIQAIAEREAGRVETGYHSYSVEQLYEAFVNETPRIGLWLDTSELTPEETVDAILTAASW
jgi:predicted kinase